MKKLEYDYTIELNRKALLLDARLHDKSVLRYIFDYYVYNRIRSRDFAHLARFTKARYVSIIETEDGKYFILRIKKPLKGEE